LALIVPGVLFARRFLLLGAALFGLGFLRVALSPPVPESLPELDTLFTGRIVSTPNLGTEWQRAIVDIGDRYLLLYARPDQDLRAADLVKFEAMPRAIKGGSAAYWYRRGIRQSVSLAYQGAVEVLEPGTGLKTFGSAWRRDLLTRLQAHLPMETAAVAMGVVGGQQDIVPDRIIRDMTNAGTLHLLATSGFNVLLLAGCLLFVTAHFPLARWVQIAAVIVILWIYSDAVGGRPPVVRATLMAAVYFSAFFFGRRADALSAMAFSAMACAAVEPWTVLDAGFQLSFLVVFGLLLYAPPWFRRIQQSIERMDWTGAKAAAFSTVATSLVTTLIAMAFASPVLSNRFGTFSIVAPISNLITAAAVPFVYLGVAAASIGDLISPAIAKGADVAITGPFAASIIRANASLAAVPGSHVSGVFLPTWLTVGCYVLLFGLSSHRRPPEPDS
jgi:ComEC/Rec2-related protein